MSEWDEAWEKARSGDLWPLAILEYKAGNNDYLLGLIENDGVSPGSIESAFLVSIIDGTYKPTKGGRGLHKRARVLTLLDIYWRIYNEWKARPDLFGGDKGASFGDGSPHFRNLEELYAAAAEDLGMSAEAVEKVVKRNRARLRRDVSG